MQMTSGPPPPSQVELFVIQRCWFSGPHVEPSVDCRRLFTSRREAEEVAYHSAHDFANRSIFSASSSDTVGPTRQHLNATVKTILLPPSAGVTSSYAFQTCGKLFWVRSLKATVVPAQPTFHQQQQQQQQQQPMAFGAFPFDKAEVVLTEGIIGGTGNTNSRRGSEVSEGRVFVSTDLGQAKRCAVDVLTQLHLSTLAQNRTDVKISVEVFPVGKAPHANSSNVAQDWAPSPRLVMQQQQHQQQLPSMEMEDQEQQHVGIKREMVNEYDARANPNLPSKRQCQLHRQEPQEQPVSCSMMF